MKHFTSKLKLILLLAIVAGCSNDDETAAPLLSAPESIDHIRRVQINEELKFGPTTIKGIVVNNPAEGNFETGILAVQQEGEPAAILLELTNAVNYEAGQEVVINLEGSTLYEDEGELRVKNLSAVNVSTTGRTVELVPVLTDLSTISEEAPYWGPVLVQVDNLTFTSASGTMSGENSVSDGVVSAAVKVLGSASFAGETAPKKLTSLKGVLRNQGSQVVIYPRSMEDMALAVTEIKEDFEQDTNTSYDEKILEMRTGQWLLSGGITAGTSADLKNGSQSIRLQGSVENEKRKGILAMEFDVEGGIHTVKVSHGIYPASAEVSNVNPTTVDIEISRDGGATYEFVGTFTVDTQSDVLLTNEFPIESEGSESLRFRFVNSSEPFANGNRPRINLDDITFLY